MSPVQSFGWVAFLLAGGGLLAWPVAGSGAVLGAVVAVGCLLIFCNRLDSRDQRDARRVSNKHKTRKGKHR